MLSVPCTLHLRCTDQVHYYYLPCTCPTFSRNTGQTVYSVPAETNLAFARPDGKPPDAIRCASVSADYVGTIVWQWTLPPAPPAVCTRTMTVQIQVCFALLHSFGK